MTVDLNKKKRKKNEAQEEAEEREKRIREGERLGDLNYKRTVFAKARARNEAERRGGY
jgi:hypothetical protein